MLLEKINSPKDLKELNIDELPTLCEEIRSVLIKKITKTGGHFGSNLGMIEAEVALHYVFDSPNDKFVFDVSHQSYTHKILTGRKEGFMDEAKYGTLSGFTTPSESEHDMFKVGHTSTSVSLACGLAKARDLKGDKENIIAILGDGSLSGGEAFEGLDNVAMLESNFIVFFNDNEMSIAPNQGGVYRNLKALREANGEGELNFFKAMGLAYRYLDEGNDVCKLVALLESVKDINHPIVLHVHTEKGLGSDWANADKEKGHWAQPAGFVAPVESINSLGVNYLLEKCAKDPLVAIVNAATPGAAGFAKPIRDKLGKQFIDVGICEEHCVAMASGIAKNGGKPVMFVSGSFVQRTYDQLSQDLALNNNPATIVVYAAGINGGDATHVGMFDMAMISNIPNLTCLAPTTKEEYLASLAYAIDQDKEPIIIRAPKNVVSGGKEFEATYESIRKGQILEEGKDIALLGLGNFASLADDVANELKAKGYKPTIIRHLNYSKLDTNLFDSLTYNHQLLVTLEDGIIDGGFGQKVASYLGTSALKVLNYGAEKDFHDLVPYSEVLKLNHLTKEQIVEDILKQI